MKLIQVGKVRPGDLIAGTGPSGNWKDGLGPRRVERIEQAPEHSQRTTAVWLVWAGDWPRNCFYVDTQVWLAQRP